MKEYCALVKVSKTKTEEKVKKDIAEVIDEDHALAVEQTYSTTG